MDPLKGFQETPEQVLESDIIFWELLTSLYSQKPLPHLRKSLLIP